MDNNNPYKRSFKTKREEYQEKLMQKNANQEWIFGNMFGKPGGGAPLRDNQGNIISSLKSITNNNIYKYEAQDFSKGDNNISVVNNKIYNQNNIISNPYHLSNEQIVKFQINQDSSFQNGGIIQTNKTNINNNRQIIINDYLNSQNYSKINKNNLLTQNQTPFSYIISYPNIIPYNQISLFPFQVHNHNLNNTFIPNFTNINNNRIPQTQIYRKYRNSSAVTPQAYYLNKFQNNRKNDKLNDSITIQENIKKNKKEDNLLNNNNEKDNDYLLISNDNDLNNKIQNEKKLEEWKNDLRKQVEEKKKRDAEAKKEMAQKEKDEQTKYQEYLQYKNRQAEEQAKKNKLKKQKYLSKNISNNELEQSQQTLSEIQNKNIEPENAYDLNNPLNEVNIPPEVIKEQEQFKNYIDKQYDSLGQSLGQSIQNEIIKMSSKLTNKYEPSEKFENLNYFRKFSKFGNEMTIRNDKKMQKIQDIIEERELLDFIIGNDNEISPFRFKSFDEYKNNRIYRENPSFFGKNIIPNERRFVNLESDSRFIFGDFSDKKNSKVKENKSMFLQEEYEKDQENQQNNYYKVNINKSGKFGRNTDDLEYNDSVIASRSLENKTSFVPLNDEVDPNMIEKINKNIDEDVKEEKIKEKNKNNENQLQDILEENILKNLNEIDLLNKNVILYNNDQKTINNNILMNNNENKGTKIEINEKINIEEQKNNNLEINDIEEVKEIKKDIIEDNNNIKNEKQKEIQKENNEKKMETDNSLNGDKNEQNKKVSEIGIQSEPNEIINKNLNSNSQKDGDINEKLINLKDNTIESNGSNSNEKSSSYKENINEQNANKGNNENINSQENEEEESYEESGEEED